MLMFGIVERSDGPPMAISWTWRGERPRCVWPYLASSAAVKCELSTMPFFRSLSYCEVTSAVLEALVVCTISGSTPMLAIVELFQTSVAGKDGEVDLRLGKIREDLRGLYTWAAVCMVCVGEFRCSILMTCNLSTREIVGARASHRKMPSDSPLKVYACPITMTLSWQPGSCVSGAEEVAVTLQIG